MVLVVVKFSDKLSKEVFSPERLEMNCIGLNGNRYLVKGNTGKYKIDSRRRGSKGQEGVNLYGKALLVEDENGNEQKFTFGADENSYDDPKY